jgi:hypothetical protein
MKIASTILLLQRKINFKHVKIQIIKMNVRHVQNTNEHNLNHTKVSGIYTSFSFSSH